jgi:hypothetical protein
VLLRDVVNVQLLPQAVPLEQAQQVGGALQVHIRQDGWHGICSSSKK